MTNLEKAQKIANSYDGDICTSDDIQTACLAIANWKDKYYNKKLTMILNAPNEVLRIEWLQALLKNEL